MDGAPGVLVSEGASLGEPGSGPPEGGGAGSPGPPDAPAQPPVAWGALGAPLEPLEPSEPLVPEPAPSSVPDLVTQRHPFTFRQRLLLDRDVHE